MNNYLFFALVFFTLLSNIYAEIRFVSKTGTSKPPYTSWTTAADSIQKAINICKPGDTVYVGNGTYMDTVRMIPGLALIGSGMDSCIIDVRKFKAHTYTAVIMEDSCTIENFGIIVSDGKEYNIYGTGITAVNCKIKIKNNIIQNSYYGIYATIKPFSTIEKNFISAVVCLWIDSFILDADLIINNNNLLSSHLGIMINVGSKPLIKNNIIKISNNGIAYNWTSSDTVSIFNNLIYCDSCLAGFFNILKSKVFNNVVFGNYSQRGLTSNGNNIIKNNIVISPNKGDGILIYSGSSSTVVSYNNSFGNKTNYKNFTPDSTNISVDPMFENPDSLNFHLQMFSPMIHAGDPNIKNVDGTRSDIGLFGGPYGESYTYNDLAPRPPVNIILNKEVKNINISWNKNTEVDFCHYKIYKSDKSGFVIDTSKLISSIKDTLYSERISEGGYYKITSVDKQGNESNPGEEVGYQITGVNEIKSTVTNYRLFNNYPNPFNPTTKICYRIKEEGYVKLTIYDITGKKMVTLINENTSAGYHQKEFNPVKLGSLSSGVYICRIDVKNKNNIPVFSDANKLIYLK